MRDLYEILGVKPDAGPDEIRRAYRKLARTHHPDANPGDAAAEERFKEISHAHDVLGDPGKRREYDAARAFGRMGPNGGAGPTAGGPAGGFADFGDILGQFFRGFGGGRRPSADERAAARRGGDVEVEVNLSFDQAMAGVQLPVSFDRLETCARCSGSGAKPGTHPRLCPECRGRGVRGRDAGAFALSEPCPRCGGNGTVIDEPCGECDGVGSTRTRVRETVKIPAGVRDGTKIRKRGKGQAGARGGPPGDLIVVTRVAPSRLYRRSGDDLEIQVPVTFAEAALGAQVEVPTVDGRVKLTVPAGSPDGKALRVPGKGAPRLRGEGRGDLIARLRVQVPRELSKRQRDALTAFAKLDTRDPRETLFS